MQNWCELAATIYRLVHDHLQFWATAIAQEQNALSTGGLSIGAPRALLPKNISIRVVRKRPFESLVCPAPAIGTPELGHNVAFGR